MSSFALDTPRTGGIQDPSVSQMRGTNGGVLALVLGLLVAGSVTGQHAAAGAPGWTRQTIEGEASGKADLSLSADGRYLAGLSTIKTAGGSRTAATVRDVYSHRVEIVSVARSGAVANADIDELSMSSDARYVAFSTVADNLVPGDTNHALDVFVRDRVRHTTTRVSVGPGGKQLPSGAANFRTPLISGDGSVVLFYSTENMFRRPAADGSSEASTHLYAYVLKTHRTELISGAGGRIGDARSAAISGSGRFVAFSSGFAALTAAATGPFGDIYLLDRATGSLALISGALDTAAGQDFSDLSMDSAATTLVFSHGGYATVYRQWYVMSLRTGAATNVDGTIAPLPSYPPVGQALISADGSRLLYAGGTPAATSAGADAQAIALSEAGMAATWHLRNLKLGTATDVVAMPSAAQVTQCSPANGGSYPGFGPALSPDGKHLAFASTLPLVAADGTCGLDYYLGAIS